VADVDLETIFQILVFAVAMYAMYISMT